MKLILTAVLLIVLPHPLSAQGGAYRDPVAADLVARARESRAELGRSISSYTAIVRHRSAANLRLPLRDRLLDRTEEVARIHWSRDGDEVIQLLGSRQEDEDGVQLTGRGDFVRRIFDPSEDRLYLPLAFLGSDDDDEIWGIHPLAEGSESAYEYGSGDTLTIRLGDRSVRAIQLNVFPRVASFSHFAATLWIEPESGAVVQASFRPSRSLDIWNDPLLADEMDDEDLRYVPGFLKDMEFDFESLIVQYSLWDFEHWLPRVVRIEGHFRAGGIRVPFADETSYEIEEVVDDEDAPLLTAEALIAAWGDTIGMRELEVRNRGDRPLGIRLFAPEDSLRLTASHLLPPPIWERSGDFIAPSELESILGEMTRQVPRGAIPAPVRVDFEWGLGGPGLVRYNRVEGLSVGARVRGATAISRMALTLRAGTADLTPAAELAIDRQMWGRTVGASVYHQLLAVDPSYLGFGNSVSALFTGHDGGQYYRGIGGRVTLSPSVGDRAWYTLALFAERQQALERQTTWSVARLLGSGRELPPNIMAGEGDVAGASITLLPWWGRSPNAPQGGIEYFVEGVTGDFEFVRSSATLRATTPVGPTYRVAFETGAGTSWGDPPAQSIWYLGGSRTLRGYDSGVAVGSSFVRGRAELARSVSSVGLAVFGDAGWAGERGAFERTRMLYSAGVGATLFEGLMRVDVVRAISEPSAWGVELYLDALL